MSLACIGAHRVGKTTLAKAVAAELELPWVQSDVAGVLDALDLDASKQMDFKTRMFAQHAILEWHNNQWGKHRSFVTDRSPLDFLMYTLGDIHQESNDWDADLLKEYSDACYDAANKHFSSLVLVQPGIPLIGDSKNTGAMNKVYIDMLNTMILGIASDPRLETLLTIMPAEELDLGRRIQGVKDIYNQDLRHHQAKVKKLKIATH